MSIFRDLVAGLDPAAPGGSRSVTTRVVIGDDGTFQTAKGEIMSDEDTAVAMEPKPTTGLKTPICRHCGKQRVNRPRLLCWTCYYTPGVRGMYGDSKKPEAKQ